MKINYWYRKFLGDDADDRVRAGVLIFSVLAFMGHLLIYALHQMEMITVEGEAKTLVNSPLSSLYTPFSILLTFFGFTKYAPFPATYFMGYKLLVTTGTPDFCASKIGIPKPS